jgi:hypothetical protein
MFSGVSAHVEKPNAKQLEKSCKRAVQLFSELKASKGAPGGQKFTWKWTEPEANKGFPDWGTMDADADDMIAWFDVYIEEMVNLELGPTAASKDEMSLTTQKLNWIAELQSVKADLEEWVQSKGQTHVNKSKANKVRFCLSCSIVIIQDRVLDVL